MFIELLVSVVICFLDLLLIGAPLVLIYILLYIRPREASS
jgi:hypothetical protein